MTEIEKLYGGVPSFRQDHPWFGVMVDTAHNFPVVAGTYIGNGWFLTSLLRLEHLFARGLSNSTYFERFKVRFGIISARETPEQNTRVREYSIARDVAHPDFKVYGLNQAPLPVVDFYLNGSTVAPEFYTNAGWLMYQFWGAPGANNVLEFPTADLLLVKLIGNPEADGVIPLGLPSHSEPLWNTIDPHQIIGMGEDYIFLERFYSRDFFTNSSDIESNTRILIDDTQRTIVKKTPVHLTTSDGYRDLDLLNDTWFKILRHFNETNLPRLTASNQSLDSIDLLYRDQNSNLYFYPPNIFESNTSEWFEGMGIWATSDRSGASSFRIVNVDGTTFSDMMDIETPIPADSPYSVVADQGAPLVATSSDGRMYLAGVFSWSRFYRAEFPHQLGHLYPDVFTSVQYNLNWINSVTSSDRDFVAQDSYQVELDEMDMNHNDPIQFEPTEETESEYYERLLSEYQNIANSLDDFESILTDLELFDVLASDSNFQTLITSQASFSSDLGTWITNIQSGNSDSLESDYAEYLTLNANWTSDREDLQILVTDINQNKLKLEPAVANGDIYQFISDSHFGDFRYLHLYKQLNTSSPDRNWYNSQGTVFYSSNYNCYTVRANARDRESILQARNLNLLNRYETTIRSAHLITNIESSVKGTGWNRLGFFNEQWGYYFRFEITDTNTGIGIGIVERHAGVDYVIDRADWNIDSMDGEGISGIELEKLATDPKDGLNFRVNCFPRCPLNYWFRYEPSGFIFVGFQIAGKIHIAHIFGQRTRILNNLPLRIEVNNSDSDTSNFELESRLYDHEVSSIQSQNQHWSPSHLPNLTWRNLSYGNIRSGVQSLSSTGEAVPVNTPVLSIRSTTPSNGMPPVTFQITELQLLAFSQVPLDNPEIPFDPSRMELYWELVLNARLPSATWLVQPPLNSQLELDDNSSQMAEGVIVASGMARGLEVIKPDVFLTGHSIGAVGDSLTLAVRGIRSGLTSQSTLNSRNLDLWYLIKWQEF